MQDLEFGIGIAVEGFRAELDLSPGTGFHS